MLKTNNLATQYTRMTSPLAIAFYLHLRCYNLEMRLESITDGLIEDKLWRRCAESDSRVYLQK